jgi:hypothetical protein
MQRRGIELLVVGGFFTLLTVVMTWPQALHLASQAPPHQDVFFNMWRLRWFAHALITPSANLFDANIFYPEPRTLALSDAMFVEGIIAAPMVWGGMRPVLMHNLMMLGAIAASGAAMYALCRYLTGSRGAALIAGIVFAFAPYRFEHIMHMEMQWTMWMPLGFLMVHRTFDTGRWNYGLAAGACVALQMLSSIYYGIFLATLLGVGALLLVARDRRVSFRRASLPLAAGGLLAAAIAAAYAQPYLQIRDRMGDRPTYEVRQYSAVPTSYLAATPNNWLYGQLRARGGGPERRLFPGTIPVVLAIVGLLLVPPSRRTIVYLLLLAAAFEASLGFGGYSYTFLYNHVSAYHGLRAVARLGIFVVMFLGVLAAFGYQALCGTRPPAVRRIAVLAVALGLLAEYHVTLELSPYANEMPPVYRFLSRHPRGVVAEFPMPRADALPGYEPEYAYMSSFHWFPLVNGYSGVYPPSYLARLDRLRGFPDQRSLTQLRSDQVRYVMLHVRGLRPDDLAALRLQLQQSDAFVELGSYNDADAPAVLFAFK